MGEDKNISQETKIEFTLKQFIGIIISILTIFIGFYTLVIKPQFQEHDTQFINITNKIDEGFNKVNDKLIEMNNGIGVINGNIDGINNRFRDLNQIRSSHNDSGGSLGD